MNKQIHARIISHSEMFEINILRHFSSDYQFIDRIMFYKHLSTKHSLDTLETQPSLLDPDLYRTTIHAIIAEIRCSYNGPELKELLININRLQEYNMIKLARCNQQLQKQATFTFKLTEIQSLLQKYNMSFLKVLEDSPDYRLDDLYRRFVHINHKLSELDPDHMKIFGGNINDNTGSPGKKVAKFNEKMREKVDKSNNENARLKVWIQEAREENDQLRREIENAKVETRDIIDELIRFREIEKEYGERIGRYEEVVEDLERKIEGKNEMLRQKDELVQNYKTSIEKLKFSLLTPTKLTKSNKDGESVQKIGSTNGTFYNHTFQHNTARQALHLRKKESEQEQRLSPGFRSQKGGFTPKSYKTPTPPRPPSVIKLSKTKTNSHLPNTNDNNNCDLWNMLLVQCVSIEQMINLDQ